MKYDITKPMGLKVGMYDLNKNVDYNFQLGRLVNMDGADLKLVRRIADKIHDNKSWKSVLLRSAVKLDKAGDIKNAMAFYRMAEFFMEWDDPFALKAWKRARKLFFEYYSDYFSGKDPVIERFEIPFEGYTMPCLKLKPCHKKHTHMLPSRKALSLRTADLIRAMRNSSRRWSICAKWDIPCISLKARGRVRASGCTAHL